MFILKKIFSNMIYPFPFCFDLLVLGLLFLLFTRFQRIGKGIVAAGMVLLAVFSFAPVPGLMGKSLEHRYWPVNRATDLKGVHYIAVLGSGYTSDYRLPPNSRLNPTALARLVEGIRLHRMIPESRLIFSGAAVFETEPSAEGYAKTAELLGVDRKKMILVTDPKDTVGEAHRINAVVGNEPFVLVTSAVHMPRALALFKKQGARPIPSPADYRKVESPAVHPSDFFPNSENLVTARYAWHEYLGMVWAKLNGSI
jgi:uncharacterized SAM-binding protein YcdF (DUF218 family)